MTDRDLTPPDYLNDAGKRIWRDTLTQLLAAGTRARVDPNSLTAYVSAVQAQQRAAELLSQTDILIDREGRPVANPALEIAKQAALTIAAFDKTFRLNRAGSSDQGRIRPTEPIRLPGTWYCAGHNQWHGKCFNRDGSRCHGPVMEGTATCRMHQGRGGKLKHLVAVEQRNNPIAGEPLDIGPAQALLWRVRVLAGEVARLDVTCASLERDELVWGRLTETDDDVTGRKTTYGARTSMWQQIRQSREAVLQSNCEAALRANVAERLVDLQVQQAQNLQRFIMALLGDFGIPADDPRIPVVVPQRLRELDAG
jgi:P27 family predicted phage terminase small subunit